MVTMVTLPKYQIGTPITTMLEGRLRLGQVEAQVSTAPPIYRLALDDGGSVELALSQFAPIIGNVSTHGRGPGRVLLPIMSQVTRKSDGVIGLIQGYCFDYQGKDERLIREYMVWFASEAAQGPRNDAPSELIAVKDERGHLIVQSRWE